jgi:PhnB protein
VSGGRAGVGGRFKPEGYTSVAPYIMVDGAQGVVDFLRRVFGGTQLRRFDAPGGGIMHVEVRVGDTVVMLADAGETHPAFPIWLHVYVPDVDAAYARAIEAGGEAVQAPVQKPGDPDRRGGVKDPAGNTWWISTQIE